MRVTVTGAAGKLGSRLCGVLAQAGHEVVATDKSAHHPPPVPLHEANLLDRSAVFELIKGSDAVVHLGNWAGMSGPETHRIFPENLAMNMNVFEAAAATGAKRIVFASSIQVIASEPTDRPAPPPYLPLDAQVPPNPGNPYALSKYLGEVMLRDHFCRPGMQCVAIRFPRLLLTLNPGPNWRVIYPLRLAQGLSYLAVEAAARLILAILAATFQGFRIYLPAADEALPEKPVAQVIQEYYPEVPLRRPVSELRGLIDNRPIEAETGWRPTLRLATASS